jgi:nucleotide-binding universal stress UspA family protein
MAACADEGIADLPATGRTVVVGFEPQVDEVSAVLLGSRLAEACQLDLVVAVSVRDTLADLAALHAGLDVEKIHARWIDKGVEKLRRSLAGHFDREFVHQIVQAGSRETVLAEVVEARDASLLIVDGGRHQEPSAWIRHGTVGALLRHVDVPVLLVGPGASRLERVVVAIDATDAARTALAWGTAIGAAMALPVEGVHVLTPEVADLLAADSSGEADDVTTAVHARVDQLTPASIARRVVQGDPADELERVSSERDGTLLVLGRHGYGWLKRWIVGSTTAELLTRMPCSLLVVPVPRADQDGKAGSPERGDGAGQ